MVDNLEEALCATCFTNLLGTPLHSRSLSGEKVAEVNDRRSFAGNHFQMWKGFDIEF